MQEISREPRTARREREMAGNSLREQRQKFLRDSAEWLVTSVASPDAEHQAALTAALDELKQLPLSTCTSVLAVEVDGKRAAHHAASRGNVQALRQLVEFQPRHAHTKSKSRSPIHDAAKAGSVECIELLLAAGADVDARDRRGYSALHEASECVGNEHVVRLLLTRGADVHARTTEVARETALHLAASTDPRIVQTLLEFGADASAINGNRETALCGAAALSRYRHRLQPDDAAVECVRLLVAHGASADVTNASGMSLLTAAVARSDLAIMRALLDAGVNVNGTVHGRTLKTTLKMAMETRNPKSIELLLRAGADLNASSGWPPLYIAAGFDHAGKAYKCCDMLLCAGVSPAVREKYTSSCYTPLERGFVRAPGSGPGARVGPLLLAFGSPLHRTAADLARIQPMLPAAVALAQKYVDALVGASSGAHAAAAVAQLEVRLAAAAEATAAAAGAEAADCPFTRLRRLRAMPWQEAWRHAPSITGRPRFSSALDRLAWARALQAPGGQAEAAAAGRTVTVLRQLSGAPRGSRERDKLLYAAAVCVSEWWEVQQSWRAELGAAEAGVEEARAQGEDTLAVLQGLLPAAAGGAGGSACVSSASGDSNNHHEWGA